MAGIRIAEQTWRPFGFGFSLKQRRSIWKNEYQVCSGDQRLSGPRQRLWIRELRRGFSVCVRTAQGNSGITAELGDKRSMSRFKIYSPDQAYLPPPSVRDELGTGHLCFFVRGVIERLDMSVFEQSYSAEGGELYAPELMLGVWLYAYALGTTSARQVERRLVEDLAFRYLAAGERVDNWALSAFRRRHSRALNDAFTQVLEWAQQQGMVKLGRAVIDSTRIAANASKDGVDSEQALRDTRARLRRQVRPGRSKPTATMLSRAGWRWPSAS